MNGGISPQLLRLVCVVAAHAIKTEEMSRGAVWARCGLCNANGAGTSVADASQRLQHQESCPYPELQEVRKESDRAAA